MSNPIARQSIDGETGTATGSDTETLGHTNYALFVAVTGTDATGVEVTLEGSPDRTHWAPLDLADGSDFVVDDTDLATDPDSGAETAFKGGEGRTTYIRHVRARVSTAPADASVDAWVMAAANAGPGNRPTERRGPASDL